MPRKNELTYLLKKFENSSENSETIQMTSETSANAKNTNDDAGQYSFMVFFSFSIYIKPETGSFHIFSLTRLASGKNAPASRAISAGSDEINHKRRRAPTDLKPHGMERVATDQFRRRLSENFPPSRKARHRRADSRYSRNAPVI